MALFVVFFVFGFIGVETWLVILALAAFIFHAFFRINRSAIGEENPKMKWQAPVIVLITCCLGVLAGNVASGFFPIA